MFILPHSWLIMLLYDSFTIALRYSVKLPFSQFARACIVHNYVSTQKSFRIATKKRQSSLKIDHSIAFIIFFKTSFSCKIENTVPCEIRVTSTILRTLIRWPLKTISWIFQLFRGSHSNRTHLLYMYGNVETYLPNCKQSQTYDTLVSPS